MVVAEQKMVVRREEEEEVLGERRIDMEGEQVKRLKTEIQSGNFWVHLKS
jgi:anti-sigma28 factor (negative regulator of flagellin synthesis)